MVHRDRPTLAAVAEPQHALNSVGLGRVHSVLYNSGFCGMLAKHTLATAARNHFDPLVGPGPTGVRYYRSLKKWTPETQRTCDDATIA